MEKQTCYSVPNKWCSGIAFSDQIKAWNCKCVFDHFHSKKMISLEEHEFKNSVVMLLIAYPIGKIHISLFCQFLPFYYKRVQ